MIIGTWNLGVGALTIRVGIGASHTHNPRKHTRHTFTPSLSSTLTHSIAAHSGYFVFR